MTVSTTRPEPEHIRERQIAMTENDDEASSDPREDEATQANKAMNDKVGDNKNHAEDGVIGSITQAGGKAMPTNPPSHAAR